MKNIKKFNEKYNYENIKINIDLSKIENCKFIIED